MVIVTFFFCHFSISTFPAPLCFFCSESCLFYSSSCSMKKCLSSSPQVGANSLRLFYLIRKSSNSTTPLLTILLFAHSSFLAEVPWKITDFFVWSVNQELLWSTRQLKFILTLFGWMQTCIRNCYYVLCCVCYVVTVKLLIVCSFYQLNCLSFYRPSFILIILSSLAHSHWFLRCYVCKVKFVILKFI